MIETYEEKQQRQKNEKRRDTLLEKLEEHAPNLRDYLVIWMSNDDSVKRDLFELASEDLTMSEDDQLTYIDMISTLFEDFSASMMGDDRITDAQLIATRKEYLKIEEMLK